MERGEEIVLGEIESGRDAADFGKAVWVVDLVKGPLRGKVALGALVDEAIGARLFDVRDGGRMDAIAALEVGRSMRAAALLGVPRKDQRLRAHEACPGLTTTPAPPTEESVSPPDQTKNSKR